jgi:hypothetical protein
MMGVVTEGPENLVLVLPIEAARRLVRATNVEEQQPALLEARAFINGEPVELQVGDNNEFAVITRDPEPAVAVQAVRSPSPTLGGPVAMALASMKSGNSPAAALAPFETKTSTAVDLTPVRDTSTASLKHLQDEYQDKIYRLLKNLGSQAQFVSYAPPTFITFHEHVYLQLSTTTALPASTGGSRYKLAALAFDDHIAHLIRPVASYFQNQSDFDGFVFSTSIHLAGSEITEAVEFFLPIAGIRCYAQYDCTGQQLLTSGYIFINGERASLDLQIAEQR